MWSWIILFSCVIIVAAGIFIRRRPKNLSSVFPSPSPSPKWIISMTTLPDRYGSPFFKKVLRSILSQKCDISFEIFIFLPRRCNRFPHKSYIDTTPPILDRRVSVHRCQDLGPATKFLGIMTEKIQEFSHVLVCDDDIVLRPTVFQQLYTCSQRDPTRVWANAWTEIPNAPFFHVEGYAGILIPRIWFDSFRQRSDLLSIVKGLDNIHHPCYDVDDDLLSYLLYMTGIKVTPTGLDPFQDWMDRSDTDTHPRWFELGKDTPRATKSRLCRLYLQNLSHITISAVSTYT